MSLSISAFEGTATDSGGHNDSSEEDKYWWESAQDQATHSMSSLETADDASSTRAENGSVSECNDKQRVVKCYIGLGGDFHATICLSSDASIGQLKSKLLAMHLPGLDSLQWFSNKKIVIGLPPFDIPLSILVDDVDTADYTKFMHTKPVQTVLKTQPEVTCTIVKCSNPISMGQQPHLHGRWMRRLLR